MFIPPLIIFLFHMLCFNTSTTHKIYLSIMKNHNSFRRQKSEKKLHSKLLVALFSIEIFINGFKQTKILWNFVNGFQICLNIFLYIRFLYIIRKGNIYCVIFFCDLDPVILASVSLWLGQIWFGTRRCRQTWHMVFIIPKCHCYYPEISRSEAYELDESHFSVKLWLGHTGLWNRKFLSDIWFSSSPRVIFTTLKTSNLRHMG